MYQFSSQQKNFHQEGAGRRQEMIETIVEIVEDSLDPNRVSSAYCDAIVSGTTGIGKTYNAEKILNEKGIFPLIIKGNQSLSNLATSLMVFHYKFQERKKPGQKLVILFDDCDSLFENKQTINILKGMTGAPGSRMLQHNVQVPRANLNPLQLSILEQYQPADGSVGIHVSTEDMVFIFTTNFMLPTEKQARDYLALKGPTSQANRKIDLSAIRRRFTTRDFILTKETNWGWLVEVGLNDGGLDMLPDQTSKMILLDWMWNNWDHMTESNISTMEKMALTMVKYPDNYRDRWERSYIDQLYAY